MNRIKLCTALLPLLAGCTFGDRFASLAQGDEETEVWMLGLHDPDEIEVHGACRVLRYRDRYADYWPFAPRSDFYIVLKAGRIAERGSGSIDAVAACRPFPE